MSVIARFLLARHLTFPQGFQSLLWTITTIGKTFFQQLINYFVIFGKAFGLVERTLIVLKPEPRHRLQNGIYGFCCRTLQIGVFNAQYILSTVFPGMQPGKQRGACATNVQIARRTGRKTCFGTHELLIGQKRSLFYEPAGPYQAIPGLYSPSTGFNQTGERITQHFLVHWLEHNAGHSQSIALIMNLCGRIARHHHYRGNVSNGISRLVGLYDLKT